MLLFFFNSLIPVTYKINSAFCIPDDKSPCINTTCTGFKRKNETYV